VMSANVRLFGVLMRENPYLSDVYKFGLGLRKCKKGHWYKGLYCRCCLGLGVTIRRLSGPTKT
jgi:hypothetical protein